MIPSPHKRQGFALLEVIIAIAIVALTSLSIIGLQSNSMVKTNRNAQSLRALFAFKNIYAQSYEQSFASEKATTTSVDGMSGAVSESKRDSWLHTFSITTRLQTIPEQTMSLVWYIVKQPTKETG